MEQKLWQKVFDFLASLKLAVVVIVGLAVVLAVATFLESKYDTKTAHHLVYTSPYFMAILALLGINVAFAAIKRYPWKKHQIGFVLTHAGIVVILIGAFISYIWGIEGTMALAEGEETHLVALDRPVMQIEFPKDNKQLVFPAEFRFNPPLPGKEFVKPVSDKLQIMVDRYIHKSVANEIVTNDGGKENPAINISFLSKHTKDISVNEWLYSNVPPRQSAAIGPLKVFFYRADNKESLKYLLNPKNTGKEYSLGRLHLIFPDGDYYLTVANHIGDSVVLPNLPYKVKIVRYLPYAVVDGNKLVSKSKDPVNPCVEFLVVWQDKDGISRQESHVTFARFPEFSTLHGGSESSINLKVQYEFPMLFKQENELLIIDSSDIKDSNKDPNKEFYYKMINKNGASDKNEYYFNKIKIGEEVNLNNADFSFVINHYYTNAESHLEYSSAGKNNMAAWPAVHIICNSENENKKFWLQQGESQTFTINGNQLTLSYGNASLSLPFTVELKQFIIGRYPGTSNPASFTSNVVVNHPGVYIHKSTSISMNNPLKWGGYTFYQSSYQETPGQPTVSVLSVSKDPGRAVKYAGSLIMIIGIITMYYFKKYLKLQEINDNSQLLSGESIEKQNFKSTVIARERGHRSGTARSVVVSGRRSNLINHCIWLFAFLIGSSYLCQASTSNVPDNLFYNISTVAILNEGRIKPLDTFARENVLLITGKESLKGKNYWQIFMSWLRNPVSFEQDKIIRITHLEYKNLLGLPKDIQYFTAKEIVENPKFKELYEEIIKLRANRQDLPSNYSFKETENVTVKIEHLYEITTMQSIIIIPPLSVDTEWESIVSKNQRISVLKDGFDKMIKSYNGGNFNEFLSLSKKIKEDLTLINPLAYPSIKSLEREVYYNSIKPFRKAWILYLGGLILLLLLGGMQNKWIIYVWILLYFLGFMVHTYGFILRTIISGRAPVSNMYESVIWVAWGAVLLSIIFHAIYKNKAIIVGAGFTAVISLILADNVPLVLNPAITPLAPVLRNNFWLTSHVLVITLSYAAFLLALGLGHLTLIEWFRFSIASNISAFSEKINQLTQYLYKSMQVGVLLLATGTILGGVWADYSWGRFWGWDPKEVWALVALLGYLAILHGRYAGWLGEFGMAVGSIAGFLGVLMAWYGVNYVLGVGLHSYGFGGGGVGYVAVFSVLDLLFVGVVAWKVKIHCKALK